ncbi:MAG TPA: hypothetical protein PK907_04050 [Candidatus Sabulitectum sp.]|nr:hypothetical protein [Candidatus Sabulitectum sp.]
MVHSPGEAASEFAASAAWKWQNTHAFILRGRARLQGRNQVFSGPFILLASVSPAVIRGDFCGPDGSPTVSILGDSTGFTVYQPGEARAVFYQAGLPVHDGLLDVNAVISLLRTGYPDIPVHWVMDETYLPGENGSVQWTFASSSSSDPMTVNLEPGDLFPSVEAGPINLSVTASSWHDSFRAWPLEWLLDSPELGLVVRLRSIEEESALGPERWILTVPVPVDTVSALWEPWAVAGDIPIR